MFALHDHTVRGDAGVLSEFRAIKRHRSTAQGRVPADAQQLKQLVINLVGNAVEYKRPGGQVKVTVTREAESAVLTVSDDGHNISEEDLPHIFERFFRTDKPRSFAEGHMGLGEFFLPLKR